MSNKEATASLQLKITTPQLPPSFRLEEPTFGKAGVGGARKKMEIIKNPKE